jgi:ATP-binding cassette subfamily B protein RaxB
MIGAGLPRWRGLPDIRQTEVAECGLACLAMVSTFLGRRVDLATLRRDHPVSLKGCTLRMLLDVADKIGLSGRPLRLEPERLKDIRVPAILHWDMSHFVVLKRAGRSGITIHDPALGIRRYTLAETSRHFTGIALEVSPGKDYRPVRECRLSVIDLIGSFAGTVPALVQIFILSLFLQLYVLASPFYLQLAVDNAIAQGDGDLLLVLVVGFLIAVLINAGAALLRTRILCHLQGALAVHIGARLFRHLLHLPLIYFERRHVGDVTSRFYSMDPIRNLLTESLLAAVLDGLMAVLTLTMTFLYSVRLGLVVLAALSLYVALRLAMFRFHRRLSLDLVASKETVRAIQGIKLFGRETERGAVWMNRFADVVQADTSINAMKQMFRAVNDLIFGIENIVVVYFGARMALGGEMTAGMLFAFVLYKQQFVDKAIRLVEKAIEFRMLDVNLERISDIVGTEPEQSHARRDTRLPSVAGEIEVCGLSFRYSEGEPMIFENVSFTVGAGENVAIIGPSGGGKTTLLKIVLGLLPPTSGEVRFDGVTLRSLGTTALRENVGVVMQEDQLMAGSIADNICFFAERLDHDHMWHCAKVAGVHDEIMRMPMAYDSLIGDMGSSLSGGQKQRILLARALYKRPRILLMDEATSHLDVALEQRVTTAVKALGLTCIIVAHRPETIASAERRLVLRRDGMVEATALDPRKAA